MRGMKLGLGLALVLVSAPATAQISAAGGLAATVPGASPGVPPPGAPVGPATPLAPAAASNEPASDATAPQVPPPAPYRAPTYHSAPTYAPVYGAQPASPEAAPMYPPARYDRAEKKQDEEIDPWLRPSFGFRLGGYSFRNVDEDGDTKWNEAQTGGIGAFGTLDFGHYVYSELGLDFYSSDGGAVEREGIDRFSTAITGAVGVRMFPKFVITPNVHIGLGAQFNKVEAVELGIDETRLDPVMFIGVGVEGNIGDHVRLGLNVRFLAAFYAEVAEPPPGNLAAPGELENDFGPAAQAQLFFRYAL